MGIKSPRSLHIRSSWKIHFINPPEVQDQVVGFLIYGKGNDDAKVSKAPFGSTEKWRSTMPKLTRSPPFFQGMFRITIIFEIPTITTPGRHSAHGALAVCLRLCLTTAAFFSLLSKFFTIAVVDPHETITPLVVAPAKWRLDRGSRHPCPPKRIESSSH